MTKRPDIILLILDTQRIDRLSAFGCAQETSPFLDAFASDAALFPHAYSPAQWTVPAHTSMFTGLYPHHHQMLHASSVLSPSHVTLAERLQEHGYFTAAFCNNPLLGVVNTGLQRGFQSFLNYSGWMTSRPNQTQAGSTLLDRYRRIFKRFLAQSITNMQDIFARSDTLLDLSFSPLLAPLWQTALSFKGNTGRALQDAASLHIERKGLAEDQAIFSFINLMGTHMPYHPPRHFIERFAPQVLRDKTARKYLRRFNSDVFGWLAPLTSEIDEEKKATLDGMYNAEVANQDELVGKFLARLRASGRLDQTMLIVCADHGEHLGEKRLMGHSISLYNTLVHVPLIIRDPAGDFPRGSSVEQVVSTRRLFHTILTAAGNASAIEANLSLAQRAGSAPDAEQIFAVGVTPQNLLRIMERRRPDLIAERCCDQPRNAVWDGHYKYIQTGTDQYELYDVFADPDEDVDLSAILPEKVEELHYALQGTIGQVETLADTSAHAEISNDPQVARRLHDLGYLE